MAVGPGMTPKLLVGTVFGIRITDRAWLEHRLLLFSAVTAPSLLAQEDQGFEWAIFVGPGMAADVCEALEEILAPFDGRAFVVPRAFGAAAALPALAAERGLAGAGGYVLTGRIDDDDAWSRSTVGTVRERTAVWMARRDGTSGFGLTFEDGLAWTMYDMLDIDRLERDGRRVIRPASIRPFKHAFTSMSVFVCAQPDQPGAVSGQHSLASEAMESMGFAVESIATDRPMWLYCRHKQAGDPIHKTNADEVEMSVADLAVEFGLDEARTNRYVETAGEHGYVMVPRVGRRLFRLFHELKEVERQIEKSASGAAALGELTSRRAALKDEMARVSANVVGDPDEFGELRSGS